MNGMKDKLNQIAARIKELRIVTGLSVEEMAARTGTTASEYEACEAGQRNLSVAFLYHCALSFGVDMGDLLEGKSFFAPANLARDLQKGKKYGRV